MKTIEKARSICRDCLKAHSTYIGCFESVLKTADFKEPVSRGSGGDISLKIDLASERFWLELLKKLGETYKVSIELVSEEKGVVCLGDFPEKIYAIMDPLDGSFNIKCNIFYYSVGIAFALEPVVKEIAAAFIIDIPHNTVYYSLGGKQVFKNDRMVERITTPAPCNGLFIEQLHHEEGRKMLDLIAPHFKRVRCTGSSLLNFCAIIDGAADLYCYPFLSRVFDFAPGIFLLNEMDYPHYSLQGKPLNEACFNFERCAPYIAGYDAAVVSKIEKILS